MSQRKILTVFIYSLFLLFVGRNLTFLPTWHGLAKEKNYAAMLKEQTEKIIADTPGSYSIYYKNLTRDEAFEIDAEVSHTAASVNKVPIVVALYMRAEDEEIDLDKKVTIQEADIQNYGTGTIRYQDPGQTYSLRTLAKLSLKESDNTAAHVLTNTIGEAIVQNMIEEIGLTQTSISDNKTSVKDMGILFEKLYNGEILSESNTKEVLDFLKDTDIEDRLPRLISEATVYHKSGDAIGNIHDVGIITQGETVFYLGVMTSDIGDTEDETKQTIGETAQEILQFLRENS